MSDVTRILSRLEEGDPSASEELLPLVYDELRKLAQARMAEERPDHTLQATALVHEAYLRLVGQESPQTWSNRGHFFAAAAEAMRRILINQARDRERQKRGGGLLRIQLDKIEVASDVPCEQLLAVDEAVERLTAENAVCAQIVKLRFYGGLSNDEAAVAAGISPSTAKRHWAYARAWLFEALSSESQSDLG